MWLNKAELRKMDGFQAKCLRIRPPYITRASIWRGKQPDDVKTIPVRIRTGTTEALL